MNATYIDFDPSDGRIIQAGVTPLTGRDAVIGFQCAAVAEGFTEQIGNRPGTPWRNPTTGIVRMGTYFSDDLGDCITRQCAINTALNSVLAVQAAIKAAAEDAARAAAGRGIKRRNPSDVNLTLPEGMVG
jgi:hypothetical protein